MAASQLAVNWNDGGQTVAGVKYRNGVLAISGNYATNGLDWESSTPAATDINNGFSVVKAVTVGEWGKFFFRPDIANHKLKAFQIYKADVHHRIAHRHSVSFVSTNGSHVHVVASHTHTMPHTHTLAGHTHSVTAHAHAATFAHSHTFSVVASAWADGVPASIIVITMSEPLPGNTASVTGTTLETAATAALSTGAAVNPTTGMNVNANTTSVAVTSAHYSGPSGVLHFGRGLLVWAGESSNLDGEFTNGASLAEVTAVPITVIGTAS